MEKVLTFEGERGKRRFEFLWQAFCLQTTGEGREKRSMETMRREAKLLDKLESISEPDGEKMIPGQDKARVPKSDLVDIVVEQADIDLLKKALESIQWKPTATRDMVDAYDFISGAPELKARELTEE